MPKRWRAPKAKPGQLKAQWGKVDGMDDLCYAHGDGVPRVDARLLHNALTAERYQAFDNTWSLSFCDELEARGYDLTTLKFSIEKKRAKSAE